MSLEVGQIIDGKYSIVSLIGEGGMGAVYSGENVKIKRKVAIKVLHAGVAADTATVARFEREAQAAGTIGNDHILEILDLGELPSGDRYMVMEFLDGEPLSNRIKRHGRMTPHQVCPIIRQVLVGLGAAHAAGITHRDLKPDNIFILRQKAGTADFVKIIDFGISKFQPLGSDSKSMTRTGAIMGTPYYMSPEQARGSADADTRSDLYSVGVIMFEALTAQVPFDAETINELLFKIVLSEPVPLTRVLPDTDPAFESIVSKAMAREPSQRFQTADEFIAALDAWAREGKAVVVPPATDAKASVIAALEGRSAAAQTAHSPQLTASTWAHSNPGTITAGPSRARAAMATVLGSAALLIVLIGGLAAWKLSSRSDPPPTGVAASTVPVTESAAPVATTPPPPEPSVPPVAAASASVAPPAASAEPTATVAVSKTNTVRTTPKDKPATTAAPPAKTPGKKPATPDFGY